MEFRISALNCEGEARERRTPDEMLVLARESGSELTMDEFQALAEDVEWDAGQAVPAVPAVPTRRAAFSAQAPAHR